VWDRPGPSNHRPPGGDQERGPGRSFLSGVFQVLDLFLNVVLRRLEVDRCRVDVLMAHERSHKSQITCFRTHSFSVRMAAYVWM